MKNYDFDKITDRRNTDCLKYDFAVERGYAPDVLPFWVADMDFPTAPAIIDALVAHSRYGIFGYTNVKDGYREVLRHWFLTQHGWTPAAGSLVITPGVVFAICTAIRAFTAPGDNILIQPPVYYPFAASIRQNGRTLVESPLVLKDGHYEIDFADFEQKIIDHKVKLFLLCSPQNPTGRVWSRDELERLGRICLKHHVLIIADEIHHEFVRTGFTHTIFSAIAPELAQSTILCTSPSKTFNLAGLIGSYHIIYDPAARDRVRKQASLCAYNNMNVLSMHALIGAYRPEGYEWVDELLEVLSGNVNWAVDFIRARFKGVSVAKPEGTYMLFLDCTDWCKAHGKTIDELQKAGCEVGVIWQDGRAFHGPCHIRMNLALPLSRVQEAFERLDRYVFYAK